MPKRTPERSDCPAAFGRRNRSSSRKGCGNLTGISIPSFRSQPCRQSCRPRGTRSVGIGLAALSAISFGGSGPFAKALITGGFSPQQAAWLRIAGAAAVLAPLVLLLRGRVGLAAIRRSWPQLVLYGITAVAGCQTLFFVAVSRLPVGVAILLEFTGPVLVVCWLRFGRRQPVPRSAALGVGICLAGLACVVEVWSGMRLDLVGLLAGLGAAACQATYFVLIDRLTGVADPLVMTAAGSVVGALLLTLIVAPWSVPWNTLTETVPIGDRSAHQAGCTPRGSSSSAPSWPTWPESPRCSGCPRR